MKYTELDWTCCKKLRWTKSSGREQVLNRQVAFLVNGMKNDRFCFDGGPN